MFWADWGAEPKIEEAGMDGDPKSRTVFVKDNIYRPNGITVDPESKVSVHCAMLSMCGLHTRTTSSFEYTTNYTRNFIAADIGGLVYAGSRCIDFLRKDKNVRSLFLNSR